MHSRITLFSTACGTILSIFNNISAAEIVKTAVLAATGATVSFLVSVSLRYLFRRLLSKK